MTISNIGNSYGYYNSGAAVGFSPTTSLGDDGSVSSLEKSGKVSKAGECETCENRKYQDGSDEMVSFKSASKISPESAATRVRAHEQEHVSNAYKKAGEKGGKVLSANVSIQTSICPDCGRSYVSGGQTSTKIQYKNESNPYQQNRKSIDGALLKGMNFDKAV